MPTFNGTPGNDTLTGTSEADLINGLAGDDQLFGLEGDDQLDGGEGADRMEGGAGDDLYFVDDRLDQLVESSGSGVDQLVTSVNYTLASGVRIEILRAATGTDPIFIRGNNVGQDIYGNDGNNLLIGAGGTQFRLIPAEGNFVHMTGDWMLGGAGNDTYVVQPLDRIFENEGGGDDVVLVMTGEFMLRTAEVETMIAAEGTDPIILWGNSFAQSIYGNAGDNRINGGGGLDYLAGGAGSDSYVIQSQSIIHEEADGGSDGVTTTVSFVLPANVESLRAVGTLDLSLRGNDLDNSISGNSGNNLIAGGAGNDLLEGGAGNDFLNGGTGADRMSGGEGNDIYLVDNPGDQVFDFSSADREATTPFPPLSAIRSLRTPRSRRWPPRRAPAR